MPFVSSKRPEVLKKQRKNIKISKIHIFDQDYSEPANPPNNFLDDYIIVEEKPYQDDEIIKSISPIPVSTPK